MGKDDATRGGRLDWVEPKTEPTEQQQKQPMNLAMGMENSVVAVVGFIEATVCRVQQQLLQPLPPPRTDGNERWIKD